MHPAISYHLAQARMAGLHQHAQQNALARAARPRGGPRGARAGAVRPGRLIHHVRSARRGRGLTRWLSRHQVSGRRASGAAEWPARHARPDDLRHETRRETTMATTVTEARRPSQGSTGNRRVGRSAAARGFPARTQE
jgi:hypothetical protein